MLFVCKSHGKQTTNKNTIYTRTKKIVKKLIKINEKSTVIKINKNFIYFIYNFKRKTKDNHNVKRT